MSFSVSSNSRDLTLLEATYQIGRFIQSFVTEDPDDMSDKPWSDYSGHFCSGLNPYFDQTKQGLVLEGDYGMPAKIHTPFGYWNILGNGAGDWDKVFEAIKEPLGLELIKEGEQCDSGYIGPFWAITRWQDLKIDKPVYREPAKYIPYEEVKKVWKEFAINKKELRNSVY